MLKRTTLINLATLEAFFSYQPWQKKMLVIFINTCAWGLTVSPAGHLGPLRSPSKNSIATPMSRLVASM